MSVETLDDDGLSRRPWAKWAGCVVAALLMGGVVWKLCAGDEWGTMIRGVRAATGWQLAAMFALPVVNVLLTAATFWILTNEDREGSPRVGIGEMTALIATAGVMNLLPIKAGMVGRIAYHKMQNGIPVRRSVTVIVVELVVSGVACAMLLGATLASVRGGAAWLGVPVGMCGVVAVVLRAVRARAWRIVAALGLQYADMMAWAVRYVVCFAVMGVTLSWVQSAALTAVAQAAGLVPIGGSSLGLREWTIGLVTPALPTWAGNAAGTVTQGLSADVLNRAGEFMALVPIGLVAGGWVARRVGRRRGGECALREV